MLLDNIKKVKAFLNGFYKKDNSIWGRLTIIQLQQILEAEKILKDADLAKYLIMIIDNKSELEIGTYSIEKLKSRYLEIKTELDNKPVNILPKFCKLGGKKYYITALVEEQQTAQMIEIIKFKEMDDLLDCLHLQIASMLREIKAGIILDYNAKDHAKRAELVRKHFRAVDALALSDFFLIVWEEYLKIIPQYLSQEIAQEMI